MNEPLTQRAGVLAELPAVLRDLGADVASVFDESGIDLDTFDADTRVPFAAMLNVLDRAKRRAACPHLGILIGHRFEFGLHGPIGRLMLTAPKLGHALNEFVTWQPGYSSGAIVYLNRLDDVYAFGYGTYVAAHPGSPVLYDAVIGVALRMIEDLTNGTVKPVEIQFSHRSPEDVASYSRLTKLPMQFDQHRNCIILDAKSLQVSLPGSDPKTHHRIQAELASAAFGEASDLSTRTRHSLRHIMFTGKPTLPAVAAELCLHPRTMERRLAEEGQTFRALRDDVRFAVARELLELTDIPIGEIGEILDFASSGVFADAFHRLSGASPSKWRERASTS